MNSINRGGKKYEIFSQRKRGEKNEYVNKNGSNLAFFDSAKNGVTLEKRVFSKIIIVINKPVKKETTHKKCKRMLIIVMSAIYCSNKWEINYAVRNVLLLAVEMMNTEHSFVPVYIIMIIIIILIIIKCVCLH